MIDRRSLVMGGAMTAIVPGQLARAMAADGPLRVPITLTDSRVLVNCTIAGQGPYRFVFDTGGAIGLLDLDLIRKLKLKQLGFSRLGLSIGKQAYPIYEARDFIFGGTFRQASAAFAGVEEFGFGKDVVGSLAAGVLTAVDSELDFDAGEWRVYRDGAPDRTGWTRFDKAILLRGNKNGSPFLFGDATLGGKRFRVGLDTGMPVAMRIYRKTAEAAGLWDAPRWCPTAPDGKGRIVRAPSLGLAGTEIAGPLITITEDPQYQYFDVGIIGLPILRQFNLATSVADGALYMKRNAISAQPERYNRAGVWIDRDGKSVRVGVVGPGSPAAAGGLMTGDLLVDADFYPLIDRFQEAAGTTIALTVDRKGERLDVTLTLADWL